MKEHDDMITIQKVEKEVVVLPSLHVCADNAAFYWFCCAPAH